MPCKHCDKTVIMTVPKKKEEKPLSGKTTYFVTKTGWGSVSIVFGGKTYTFLEDTPIEAPIEMKNIIFLQTSVAPEKVSVVYAEKMTETSIKENTKKGGK